MKKKLRAANKRDFRIYLEQLIFIFAKTIRNDTVKQLKIEKKNYI